MVVPRASLGIPINILLSGVFMSFEMGIDHSRERRGVFEFCPGMYWIRMRWIREDSKWELGRRIRVLIGGEEGTWTRIPNETLPRFVLEDSLVDYLEIEVIG